MSSEPPRLSRVLGPTAALCVIVGSVIGSGIFLVPARVAQQIPAIGPILIAWVVGGVFSLAGALTLAELAARMPRAGGSYVYLKEAFGPLWAFLFGWVEFLVVRSGSMATLASAFAIYAAQLLPPPVGWSPLVWQCTLAISALLFIGFVNVLGTRLGGGLQIVGTALKVGALLMMIVLPFALGRASAERLAPVWAPTTGSLSFLAFMQAMVSVLWAYDGWVNSASLAEEIRDPERNIPRTLIGGVGLLVALYLGMTVVYHMVLPMDEIAAASSEKGSPRAVSADFFRTLLGTPGQAAISAIVMISTFISLNGNVLSGPRVYFAMARDGVFPASLAHINPRRGTPSRAIVAQVVWSIILTAATTLLILCPPPQESDLPAWLLRIWTTLNATPLYDFLYSYVIFGATVFYALSILSVFRLRKIQPAAPGLYQTWGYPFTPLVFIVGAVILLGSMLAQSPLQSLGGLAIVAAGLPAYWVFQRRRLQRPSA